MTLLCIGRLKASWIREGVEEYLERLRGNLSIIEIPASKAKDPGKQAQEESEKLLLKIEDFRGEVWVLDEQGDHMTSAIFAKEMEKRFDRGEKILFVLGGAYGLTEGVRAAASKILRLSDMTLPHELCRLVFLEQLYRAQEINRGSGYHH